MVDVENAQDLAEQAGRTIAGEAGKKIAEVTYDVVEQGRKRVRRRAKRRARKLERRVTRAAKRLPVDTPVDKRGRGRAALVVRIVLATAVVAAVYAAWRARNRRDGTAEGGPAPDAFGAAVDASDDGEQAPTTTSPQP